MPPTGDPLAYFITFRSYGTWLHGDERGSTSRKQNVFGTPFLRPNARAEHVERQRLRHQPGSLATHARQVVERAIRETCDARGWELHALAARTNHVHTLVSASGTRPEAVISSFKSWSTRYLRDAMLVDRHQRVWSHHGSTVYLWTEQDLERVWLYIVEGQSVGKVE